MNLTDLVPGAGAGDEGGLRLVVNDTVFAGWITAEVERTLDEFVPRFSLGYVDRWLPDQKPWAIRKGNAARLLFDDEVLIDGFVNASRMRIAGRSWSMSCDGRAKTCDLVDSSAVHKTGHWANKTATQIITELVKDYGLKVSSSELDLETYPVFRLESGETVHNAIDRLCKVRGFIPTTTPEGDIKLLTIPAFGLVPIELEIAKALERGWEENEQDQHSEYLLRSVGIGSEAEAFANASIIDPNVTRYRPLVVNSDAPANSAAAKTRAQWECNVRAGRSERLHYKMPGALGSTGDTYQPGQMYLVKDDALGVDEVMICARAVLRAQVSSAGRSGEMVTDIELVRPEAYAAAPYPRKKLAGKTKRGKPIVHKLGLPR